MATDEANKLIIPREFSFAGVMECISKAIIFQKDLLEYLWVV